MVKKKICDQGSSQGSEKDRISQLPDELRCHILSFVSTKVAIRASVLSTKWRNLWQLVFGLDLDVLNFYRNIDDFMIFVDRFFYFHRESSIQKLRLGLYTVDSVDYTSYLTTWMDAATMLKVQHLDLYCEHRYRDTVKIPLSLYTSETLVHLRLVGVNLVGAEFVSLPCLKILHLEDVKYSDQTTLEKLISYSPVLEDLTIVRYPKNNPIHVRSQTLKRVYINHYCEYEDQYGLVIDAPLLQYLRILAWSIKNIKFINLGFTATVSIEGHLLNCFAPHSLTRSMVHDSITSISRVRWLIIGFKTTEDIFHYLNLEPLHQFCYLSKLSASCRIGDLDMLPNLLKSCPKLETLILKMADLERNKGAEVMSLTVPPCLVSSLKFVNLIYALLGCGTELKVARYFLENSTILEKLTLRNNSSKENVKDIRQELQAIPRCSSSCEVVIL